MNRHRAAQLVGVSLLPICWAAAVASQNVPSRLPEGPCGTMHAFLDAWLVEQNEATAMGFFATTGHALNLAPDPVWEAARADDIDLNDREQVQRLWHSQKGVYWKLLNRFWTKSRGVPLEVTLTALDPDLTEMLTNELRVQILCSEPFTVFVADSDIAIDTFDAGYGDVATALQPTDDVVLTMIADFVERGHEGYMGPFVSFWKEGKEGETSGQWQIQALGAAPEGDIWIDGH